MIDQRAADRQEELRQFYIDCAMEEDMVSSGSLVYHRFFNHGGADAVRTMTKFSPREFTAPSRQHDASLERGPMQALSICHQGRVFSWFSSFSRMAACGI